MRPGPGSSRLDLWPDLGPWVLSICPSGARLLQGPLAACVHGVPGLVPVFWHLPPLPHTHLPVPVWQCRRQARQGRHHALGFHFWPRPCEWRLRGPGTAAVGRGCKGLRGHQAQKAGKLKLSGGRDWMGAGGRWGRTQLTLIS